MKSNLIQALPSTPTSVGHILTAPFGWMRALPAGGVVLQLSSNRRVFPGVASAGGEKVTLCHVPPGNPAAAHDLVVAPSAAKAHLKNHAGDHLGPCATPPECQTNDQCNDANPCTVDTCTATGTCDYSQPVVCNDDNPCTNDVCIAEQGGCVGYRCRARHAMTATCVPEPISAMTRASASAPAFRTAASATRIATTAMPARRMFVTPRRTPAATPRHRPRPQPATSLSATRRSAGSIRT